jgi:hypothetical protein
MVELFYVVEVRKDDENKSEDESSTVSIYESEV